MTHSTITLDREISDDVYSIDDVLEITGSEYSITSSVILNSILLSYDNDIQEVLRNLKIDEDIWTGCIQTTIEQGLNELELPLKEFVMMELPRIFPEVMNDR